MDNGLYTYYERELLFLRQFSQEFAKQYPAAAGRLLLDATRSSDPHVERMLESVALIAARVHQKLDDEFPELTDSLLYILYPHLVAPIPSTTIIQFELDPGRAEMPDGFVIERGTRLRAQPVGDIACRFRTAYPVTVWPISVTQASVQAPPFPAGWKPPPRTASAVRIQLDCMAGMEFAKLSLQTLRFFLEGDPQVIANLYELLFNHATQVVIRSPQATSTAAPILLEPAECLSQVGFGPEEGLLPYPEQSLVGYRLLAEFFAAPSKFLFFDLLVGEAIRRGGFGASVELVIYLNRSIDSVEQGVDPSTFRLGCTPVVNLFEQVAEPIPLNHATTQYRVVPDALRARGMEIYSVNGVVGTDAASGKRTPFEPFYAFRHQRDSAAPRAFWYPSRRTSQREGDRGTEVYLNLVDLDFDPWSPDNMVLTVATTCSNRDVPYQLHASGRPLVLELEASAPVTRVRVLKPVTPALRPPLRRGAMWRLVSHLSLNHLSLANVSQGRDALCEILSVYDFTDADAGSQSPSTVGAMIEGISKVSSRPVVGQVGTGPASGFCRGLEVTIEFDAERYTGTSLFLFACVLERFLGMYVNLNSFCQMVARVRQQEGAIKRWPPRSGDQQLL